MEEKNDSIYSSSLPSFSYKDLMNKYWSVERNQALGLEDYNARSTFHNELLIRQAELEYNQEMNKFNLWYDSELQKVLRMRQAGLNPDLQGIGDASTSNAEGITDSAAPAAADAAAIAAADRESDIQALNLVTSAVGQLFNFGMNLSFINEKYKQSQLTSEFMQRQNELQKFGIYDASTQWFDDHIRSQISEDIRASYNDPTSMEKYNNVESMQQWLSDNPVDTSFISDDPKVQEMLRNRYKHMMTNDRYLNDAFGYAKQVRDNQMSLAATSGNDFDSPDQFVQELSEASAKFLLPTMQLHLENSMAMLDYRLKYVNSLNPQLQAGAEVRAADYEYRRLGVADPELAAKMVNQSNMASMKYTGAVDWSLKGESENALNMFNKKYNELQNPFNAADAMNSSNQLQALQSQNENDILTRTYTEDYKQQTAEQKQLAMKLQHEHFVTNVNAHTFVYKWNDINTRMLNSKHRFVRMLGSQSSQLLGKTASLFDSTQNIDFKDILNVVK